MGVLKNDVGRPSNKTIRIRFILKLIGLILVVGLAFIGGYKLSRGKQEVKQNPEQNKVENKEETKEEEKVETEIKKTINIYGYTYAATEYSEEYISIRDTEYYGDYYDEKYTLLGTYACKYEDCILKQQTIRGTNTIFIKDGSYYAYDIKTKKANKINLDKYKDKLKYIDNAESTSTGLGDLYIDVTDSYIVVGYAMDIVSPIALLIDENYNPIIVNTDDDMKSENYINKLHTNLTFLEDGKVLYSHNNKYYKYDSGTGKTTASKEYKSVELISEKGYIVVVDTDNYLKVLDFNGKVKSKLVKVTDDMYIHSPLSGWYEENKKEGIYVVVEDKNTKFEELSEKLRNELGSPENANLGYEYFYIPSTGEYGKIPTYIGGYAKPVLYLYPKKDNTKVTIDFAKEDLLVTTYPKFKDKWEVTANKNGDLYDSNGKYYYGLYWDEKGSINVDFKEGFYVTKENAIDFLEEKLTIIGLNDRERNEFIMYWLPILEKNEKNLVYFELTPSREAYNKLIINPKPDSLLRVAIHIKKVDSKVSINEQKLKTFERKGFAVVEWGGVIH